MNHHDSRSANGRIILPIDVVVPLRLDPTESERPGDGTVSGRTERIKVVVPVHLERAVERVLSIVDVEINVVFRVIVIVPLERANNSGRCVGVCRTVLTCKGSCGKRGGMSSVSEDQYQ